MLAELEALDGFRAEVRDWFKSHVPANWREKMTGASTGEYVEFSQWWRKELKEGGYVAPHWPKEWGGGGNTLPEQIVIYEEMARADAPRLGVFFIALFHTPSTLWAAGSKEQQQRYIPGVLDGEIWCQGFSEPDAGSDLAALRTRADRDGDEYVVNGQKVWSSGAHRADYCLLLARTHPDAPKHKGISYFIMDMKSPGVETRPIKQATGDSEFNEMFLNDVRIPAENLIGEENEGWRIAMSTLSSERSLTIVELAERMGFCFHKLADAAKKTSIGGGRTLLDDVGVRRELVQTHAELAILRLLVNRMVTGLLRGTGVGPESSIIKLFYSELLQRFTEFGTRLKGLESQLHAPPVMATGWDSGNWMHDYINSWAWTIGGGTNEIQRNLIGEKALGLPREPRA